MIKIITIFLLILCSSVVFAQDKTVDSLKLIIQSKAHDTMKLSAIKALLDYLPQNECALYNLKMIALAEKNAPKQSGAIKKIYYKYAAEGYYNNGVFLSNKSENDSSLVSYSKAIELYKSLEDEESIAYPKMNMAIIYTTKGDFSNALNYLYDALKINEKYKNKEAIADCNVHLGRLYHIQKLEEKALAATTTAYNLYKEIDYKPGIIDALHKLSVIATGLNKPNESIIYLKQNVDFINNLNGDEKQEYLQIYFTDKATIAYRENNWDSSIYFNKKSVELAIENNNLYVLGTRYLSIAEAYKAKSNFKESLNYATMAYDLSKKNNNLAAKVACTHFLSNLYPKLYDFGKAYEMQSLFIALNDSVLKIENTKNIVEQQLKYDFEKKELKNAAIQSEKNWKKNMLIVLLSVLFLITAISTYFIVKNQRQKNIIQKQLSDSNKQKAMLAQMNPHFIFNAINSIQNFVLNNKEDEAYNYLTKFSKLIRLILHNSNEEMLTLTAEIEALNLYISLEQLRFNNSFEYKLFISDEVDADTVEIPTMLIQPYVENAIWHGLMNLKEERSAILLLNIAIENSLVKIVIEDNGIGRQKAAGYSKESTHNSVAMKLTAERLNMIKQSQNAPEISVQILDLFDQLKIAIGTRVTMYLPLIS